MCSKYKIIFLLILIIFLTFPQTSFSAPEIVVNSYPASIVAGQEFDANFSVTGLLPSTNYYSKSLGGFEFNEVDTWNLNWLQQNAAWTSMPVFTSNSEGSASANIKSRFAQTTSEGNKEYKIRIRKVDASTNYDSPAVQITVNTPAPTTIPTQTSTATATATPTSTVVATQTPVPTISHTSSPTKKSTQTPSPTAEGFVLGEVVTQLSDLTPSPSGTAISTDTSKPSLRSILFSALFIIGGLGFLGYGGYYMYNNFRNEKSSKF